MDIRLSRIPGRERFFLPLCMVEPFGVYAVMQVMGEDGRFVFSLGGTVLLYFYPREC